VLLLHDLEVEELLAPAQARCEAFTVEGLVRPRMRFQGHRLVTLEGSHGSSEEREIPAGSLIIRARQRLGRVAAQLLEGSSEDGLVTWNFFDDHLKRENDVVDGGLGYPVLRLLDLPAIGQTRRVVLEESGWQVEGALSPPPADQRGALRVQVRCADPGSLRPRGTPGPPSRREGRRLVYRVGDEVFDGIAGLDSALPRLRASLRGAALILDVGPQVREEELRAVAESGRKAGFDAIYLQRVPE
jgi:hypothetical protein